MWSAFDTLMYQMHIYVSNVILWKTLDIKISDVTVRLHVSRRFVNRYYIMISFTLYPAHSRVGRWNLVLRLSVLHFPPNSGDIACWVAEFNAALVLDTRAKKCKYKFKWIFHLLEWGSSPQPVGFTVTLYGPAPRLA